MNSETKSIEETITSMTINMDHDAMYAYAEKLVQLAVLNVGSRQRELYAYADLCFALESGDEEFIDRMEERLDRVLGRTDESYFDKKGYATFEC